MVNNNKRVIIVPFENHKLADWMADPYFSSIAKKYGSALNFHGFSSISLPDYLMETSGSNQGRTTDTFTFCEFKVNNMYDVLTANGLIYENFEEKTGSQGNHRHTPGYFYPSTCKGVQDISVFYQKYRDGTSIPSNYTWCTPNFCDDAHDCGISTASNWLKNTFKLDIILQKPWFQDGSTLVTIVCDDGGSASNPTMCFMVSTSSLNKTSNVNYNHVNDLSTAMWWLGLSETIGNANASKAMKDLFLGTALLTASETIVPTTITIGQSVTFTAIANGGSPPYIYSWNGLPTQCHNNNSSTITCNPDTAGTYIVDVTVTDTANNKTTATGTLVVNKPTSLAASLSINPNTITIDQQTIFAVTATGGITPYTYSWTNIPTPCTDGNVSKITCNPNETGTYNIMVTVTDSAPTPDKVTVSGILIVNPTSTGSITVTNPITGLIYRKGEPRVVRWKSTGSIGPNVKIGLIRSNTIVKVISPNTPNDGQMSWTVPSVTSATDYQIKITSLSNIQILGVSGKFTIK